MGTDIYKTKIYGISFTYTEALKLKNSKHYKKIKKYFLENESSGQKDLGENDEASDYLCIDNLWEDKDLINFKYRKYNIKAFIQCPFYDMYSKEHYIYHIGVYDSFILKNKAIDKQIKKICDVLSLDYTNKKIYTHDIIHIYDAC